jgi:hypothetical protein
VGLAAHDCAAQLFHRAAVPELDAGKLGLDRNRSPFVDFTVPVDGLRRELERIVKASPLWDKRVVNLQVTDFKESTMEIRMLVSASTAGKTFDLRCEVREKMIGFIQKRHPEALPRIRTYLRDERRRAEADVKTAAAY